MMYDIGIIGGGTAGLTAAIYGQRAGKRTLVIEGGAFGGQITTSPKVENYPGIASVSGSEFSMNLLDQAMKLGTEPVRERVTGILEEDGIKIIVTTEREYPCKSIILATGVTHRHLGVPGEERLTGAGVSYCATCDGMFFRGKEVVVVGGGSTALQDAEFLSEYCSKVYLIHRRDSFRGEERIVEGLKKKENVTFILDSVVKEICGEIQVEGLELQNLKTGEKKKLPVSGLPTSGLPVSFGIKIPVSHFTTPSSGKTPERLPFVRNSMLVNGVKKSEKRLVGPWHLFIRQ